MTKRQIGELMPHELPHESLDRLDSLIEGLPKLANKNSGQHDATPAAASDRLKSEVETSSQRLHVFNDGNVCVDLVLYYKAGGDGKKGVLSFEFTGRMLKDGALMSQEKFLLDKPVPSDLLRHIRAHVDCFDGAAGEALLNESIQKTLDYYSSATKAFALPTHQEQEARQAAWRRAAEERLAKRERAEEGPDKSFQFSVPATTGESQKRRAPDLDEESAMAETESKSAERMLRELLEGRGLKVEALEAWSPRGAVARVQIPGKGLRTVTAEVAEEGSGMWSKEEDPCHPTRFSYQGGMPVPASKVESISASFMHVNFSPDGWSAIVVLGEDVGEVAKHHELRVARSAGGEDIYIVPLASCVVLHARRLGD